MPALILDFYSNGNVNEFVKRRALADGAKLYLVGISVILLPATLTPVRPDPRDRTRYAIPTQVKSTDRSWSYPGCKSLGFDLVLQVNLPLIDHQG